MTNMQNNHYLRGLHVKAGLRIVSEPEKHEDFSFTVTVFLKFRLNKCRV